MRVRLRPTGTDPHRRPWLVYLAGGAWHGIAGTDRQLVVELAARGPVLWVDPPDSVLSWLRPGGRRPPAPGLSRVAPGVLRLRLPAPPGVTRKGIRTVTSVWLRLVLSLTSRLIGPVAAVVNAGPEQRFPRLPGLRVLHVTDDWPAGAELMGLDRKRIDRNLRDNADTADLICGVTPRLVRDVTALSTTTTPTLVLPNGCRSIPPAPGGTRPADLPAGGFALLVGQLNERLDLDLLAAVADSGVALVLLGPRTERDPDFRRRIDDLVQRPGVRWLGVRSQQDLDGYLRAASVGLTPYAVNEFNQSSFPLKSLEYLAAGLPVVSTELEATRWLDTDLISTASGPDAYAAAVCAAVAASRSPDDEERRRSYAAGHSWAVRAAALESSLAQIAPTGRRLEVSPENSRPVARC